jgi:dipeptidyl aminopeptidase/acylaminoacyl peptidase
VALPEGTLWRSRIDGSDRMELTFPPMQVFLPRWSPDGKQIAFYAQSAGKRHGIFVVPAAGGAPVDVLPPNESGIDPAWSPEGSSLVYESAPWVERGSTRKPSLRVLDLRTRTSTLVPGSEGACSPRWSPDGNFIVAMNANSNVLLLYTVAARQWSRLMALHIGYPNWSHDSKYVYFDRFADPPGIGRVRVSDGKVEQVVNVAGDDRLWTLHSWTGLAADDSPLLVRDISVQQIYAVEVNWP